MTNAEIRLLNATYVLEKLCGGSKAEMARRTGKLQQSISKWFTETGDKKNIGNSSARLIERSFGLPHSWMDELHENSNDLEKDSKKRLLCALPVVRRTLYHCASPPLLINA